MSAKTKPIGAGRPTLCVLLALIAAGAAWAAEVPGIITTHERRQFKGMVSWLPSSKVYEVVVEGRVPIQLAPKQVADVRVQKPPTYDAAAEAVRGGDYDKGIPVLEAILKDYAMLQWDLGAARWLGEAYLKQNDPRKAASTMEPLMSREVPEQLGEVMARIYWDALLGAGRDAALRTALREAIETGSRSVAALAQVKRGEMDEKKENFKEALIDGYLRTAVLYQDVESVQGEALFKAARCFDKMGQHSHAERMRKKLLAEYPDDPYTQQLRSGG